MRNYVIYFLMISIAFLSCRGRNNESTPVTKASQKMTLLAKVNNDTLRYIKEAFYDNQKKYVHKPLIELLNDFAIPVKSYIPIDSGRGENHYGLGVYLDIYENKESRYRLDHYKKPATLIIHFENPIPMITVDKLLAKDKLKWTDETRDFYSRQIVKDIDIMNYMK